MTHSRGWDSRAAPLLTSYTSTFLVDSMESPKVLTMKPRSENVVEPSGFLVIGHGVGDRQVKGTFQDPRIMQALHLLMSAPGFFLRH